MASPAEFRRLKGVGPAAEARLHDAGVSTWADLAQVLTVLAKAAARYDGLPGLARAVADQAHRAQLDAAQLDAAQPGADPGEGATVVVDDAVPGSAPAVAGVPWPLVIDAGLAIGGAARDVTVPLEPAPQGAPTQAYRAELVGRLLGTGGADTWRPLGARQVRFGPDGAPPRTVRFDATPVPDGIHRLLVRLTPNP